MDNDKLIQDILELTEQLSIKTTEAFVEAVLKKLSAIGYVVSTDDEWLIAFNIQKVNQHIMNTCNTTSVPDGMFYIAIDRVCGEILYSLKNTGKLNLDNLDLDGAITSISEGDTTVSFASGGSDDEKLTALIGYLQNEGISDEICYRKLKW